MSGNDMGTPSRETDARRVVRRVFGHESTGLALILVAIMVALAFLTKGLTVTPENIRNVLWQSSVRGLASIGQFFVILSGGIDISVGGIALMSAILGASLMTSSYLSLLSVTLPIGAALPIMLAAGTGIGFANGAATSRLGMPSLIVTLAMWQITKGIAFQISGGATIMYMPESLAFLGQGDILGVPVPIIIFVVTAVIAYFVANYTSFGRSLYAAGGNPVSAWLTGINVRKVVMFAFVIAGFLAALAGIVTTSRNMGASMVTASGLEIDSVAAVCIGGVSLSGGRGSVIGVVLGVLILGVINNGMNVAGLDPLLQDLIKGIVIFTAVAIDTVRRGGVRTK